MSETAGKAKTIRRPKIQPSRVRILLWRDTPDCFSIAFSYDFEDGYLRLWPYSGVSTLKQGRAVPESVRSIKDLRKRLTQLGWDAPYLTQAHTYCIQANHRLVGKGYNPKADVVDEEHKETIKSLKQEWEQIIAKISKLG